VGLSLTSIPNALCLVSITANIKVLIPTRSNHSMIASAKVFVQICGRQVAARTATPVMGAATRVACATTSVSMFNSNMYFTSQRALSSSSSSSSKTITAADVDMSLADEYAPEVADVLKDYEERAKRKQSLMGIVTSTKNSKSITVMVQHDKFYPKYNKVLKRRRKVMAHDEVEKGAVGDLVRIVPCRPRSAMKRHALIDIIRKAPV